MGSSINYITGTGNIGGPNGGELRSVILTPAAATATLTIRQGGSGGAVILVLQAAASGESVQVVLSSPGYSGQLHATLAGAGASAVIEI